jgi:hypothetical protein
MTKGHFLCRRDTSHIGPMMEQGSEYLTLQDEHGIEPEAPHMTLSLTSPLYIDRDSELCTGPKEKEKMTAAREYEKPILAAG